jgi:hypothetical protein
MAETCALDFGMAGVPHNGKVERHDAHDWDELHPSRTSQGYIDVCGSCYERHLETVRLRNDPARNPLTDEQVGDAIRQLGSLTGAQLTEIARMLNTGQGSPEQLQVWRKAIKEHNDEVRAKGAVLIRDLHVGSTYRITYTDADWYAGRDRGGGTLNLAFNLVSGAASLARDVVVGPRLTVTGALEEKSPDSLVVRPKGIFRSKGSEYIPVHLILAVDPA